MKYRIHNFNKGLINNKKFLEILNGWNAHSKWSNNYRLMGELNSKFIHINP